MRELTHTDPNAELPTRIDAEFPISHVRLIPVNTKPLRDLPWMRRERVDMNLRCAVAELRDLASVDPLWREQYETLASAFESAIRLLDAIEDFQDAHS